ncbi:sensor histidine kinase [Bradyrhizobium iriomotense]|uniref:sensor histidine kinase n=1 Tax=Bradyrhizobium iriomotense TaxID=441950 RepID=UPI0024E143F5|nr:sensor histidine kinase [Bradyrhizobium iriomotense]
MKLHGSPTCESRRTSVREWLPTGSEGGLADVHPNASLVSLQERIQQRIASDLHDSTCQHLIAASLGLMRLRTCLNDQAGAARLCDEIDASIDEALREIRAFAYLLHPQNLTVDGLKATIERYSRGFAARTSLHVTTRISPDIDRLSRDKQHSLLRVIQEALTNVFRHAKATEVKIAVASSGSHFQLTVSDNGRGFPTDRAKSGTRTVRMGVGIPAMRARLQQIGGTLDIQSDSVARHSGTTLLAVFPRDFVGSKRRKATTVVRAHAGTS